jgi:hypothetical protein
MPILSVICSNFRIVKENLTGAEIYAKHKPDFLINGGLYDPDTGTTMTFITHDGINAGSYFSKQGIGFIDGKLVWCKQGEAYNFIGGSPVLIREGQESIDWGNTYSSYVDGTHYRSILGIKNGEVVLYVSDEPESLKTSIRRLLDEKLDFAINLDGGGSCHLQESKTALVKSTRANASWILVWGNKKLKTNIDLVAHCQKALDEKWGYVWGTWGLVLTDTLLDQKIAQYPTVFNGDRVSHIRQYYMGKRTVDCGGLIKSFLWWGGSGPVYTPSSDEFVDTMYSQATDKGDISTIPEIPGLIVWRTGHAGVYIGNSEVIEARGTTYGVVKTKLKDRPWTHWFKHTDIHYDTNISDETSTNVKYSDVAKDRWSYADIMAVTEAGIMGGFPDGTFKPTENVAREQMAAIINRLLKQ